MNQFLLIAFVVIVLFVYINVKGMKNSASIKSVPFLFFPWLLLYSTLLLPTTIVFLTTIALFRQCVKVFLKIKHGNEFLELTERSGVVHTAEKGYRTIMKFVCLYEYDETKYGQTFYNTCREKAHRVLLKDPDRFPQLLARCEQTLGYTYLLRNKVKVDDVLKEMIRIPLNEKQELSQRDLMNVITEHTNQPLPENDTVLWEALIGTQPVNWRKNNSQNSNTATYPVLFRVHHSLCDGASIIKLLIGVLADNKNIKIVSSIVRERKTVGNSSNNPKLLAKPLFKVLMFVWVIITNLLKFIVFNIYIAFIAPSTIYTQTIIKTKDKNLSSHPKLSGKVIMGFKVEETQGYVEKVKNIKRIIPDGTFSGILFTIFAATLDNLFTKKYFDCPDYVHGIVPLLTGAENLRKMVPGAENLEINFNNTFSYVILKLPLRIGENSYVKRMQILQEHAESLRKSHDYMVNYWFRNIGFAVLPIPLIKVFINMLKCTTLLSFLPGPEKITMFEGTPMSDCVFWTPQIANTGVILSIFTYDGRFQIGLSVDRALIEDQEEILKIIENIFKGIDMFEKEVCQCKIFV